MALAGLVHKTKFLVNDNAPAILTGVGVAGTVTTAYLTGRASFKAAEIIAREEQERIELHKKYPTGAGIPEERRPNSELTRMTKVRLVWRLYIPSGTVGLTTVVCILAANRVASKKIAALTVASGISERALQEYKAKVMDRLTAKQEEKVRADVAQERVNQNPPGNREVILAGTGEVLCLDLHSGRYFQSTVEEIKRAENKINHELNNFTAVSLTEFYDELGLPPTSYSDQVGWNSNHHVEVQFSSVLTPDGRPCLAVDFLRAPSSEYRQVHG